MERIGIAASKMAQGCLLKYNIFVVGICCLFSILIFLICGFSILVALFLISIVLRWIMPTAMSSAWLSIVKLSLVGLAFVVGVLNIWSIIKNIKCSKNKI